MTKELTNDLLSMQTPLSNTMRRRTSRPKDEEWAVFWCALLRPVLFGEIELAEERIFLKKLSREELLFPHGVQKKPSLSTLKRKLSTYRVEGFDGLFRKLRCDRGRSGCNQVIVERAIALKRDQPQRSEETINKYLKAEYGETIPKSTLYRHLRRAGATRLSRRATSRSAGTRMTKSNQAYLLRAQYLGGFADDFPNPSSWFRDLRIAASTTLEELNSIVLTAIGWVDRDHLYMFQVGDRTYAWLGQDSFVVESRMFNSPFLSSAIPLDKLKLAVGHTITEVFDFGDEHRFQFTVLEINETSDAHSLPILVNSLGGPVFQWPKQTEFNVHFDQEDGFGPRRCEVIGISPRIHDDDCAEIVPGARIPYEKTATHENWRVRFVSSADKNVLDEWRKSKDKRKWEKAVAILDNWDVLPEKTAEKIERPLSVVRKWVQTFNWYGLEGLSKPRKKRDNRQQRKRVEKRTRQLIEILHQPPSAFALNRSNWNMKSIASVYEEKYGEKISKSTVSRRIRSAGYTIKKARRVLTSPDPDYREKVELLLSTLHSLKKGEMFYFIDELGPLRVKKYGGRAFTAKGETKVIPQNQRDRGSIILSGGLSATTNQVVWIYGLAKDSQAMVDLIEVLFNQQFKKSRIFVTWDAASWHRSNELLEWLDDFNTETRKGGGGPIIELVPLPSSAQFLDVIEAVFSGMKRAVIHHSDYQTEGEMKESISKHFADRNEHFTENPRRAGKKIWEVDFFSDYERIRSGNYRDW